MVNVNFKNAKSWFYEKNRSKKLREVNVAYQMKYRTAGKKLGQIAVISYFLLTYPKIEGVRMIFVSIQKQRDFIYAMIHELGRYGLSDEWIPALDRDLEALNRRYDYTFKIVQENVRLTEYHPYFQAVGYEKLLKYSNQFHEKADHDALYEEIQKWNSEHQEEIQEYVESIREEKENLERYRQKIRDDARQEKEIAKQIKKNEKREQKEIEKEQKKEKSRQKRIDKSFERYWR